jgi:hypothetical protein
VRSVVIIMLNNGLSWGFFEVIVSLLWLTRAIRVMIHGPGESLCRKLCYSDHNHSDKGVGK